MVNLFFPSFFLSPAQNTGISTLYRNSYGAPAEDIKHNQVSTETKMLLFRWQKTGLTSYMDMKNDIRKTDKSRLEELSHLLAQTLAIPLASNKLCSLC